MLIPGQNVKYMKRTEVGTERELKWNIEESRRTVVNRAECIVDTPLLELKELSDKNDMFGPRSANVVLVRYVQVKSIRVSFILVFLNHAQWYQPNECIVDTPSNLELKIVI